MGKLTIFSIMVCLIVTASSLTSCLAARGLPQSLPSDQISSSESTTSKPNTEVYDADSTVTESDEGVTNSDWEELSEEEVAACMGDAEIGTGESSRELEVERPCRRMLQRDYGPPQVNRNSKGLLLRDGNPSDQSSSGPVGSQTLNNFMQGSDQSRYRYGGRHRRMQ